ncbi:MAG TPA: gluconate 2-dehydrogenase subunit 3 family protein [Gemmatimonadaceae bacterium]|nr:gluconate 2-dehydrogenase subunit 3 family protein [Gemmatimonadaceae bacterium]
MDSPDTPETIDRREALKQVAFLLGGAISASTLAGVLARDNGQLWAATLPRGAQGWAPRTLSAAQAEMVATIAEHVIPATDTPGARAAGVHRFVDALLTDYYPAQERDRFVGGLRGVDARAQRAHKKSFMALTRAQQVALLTAMDREAYPAQGAIAQAEKKEQPAPRDPIVGPSSGPPQLPQQTPTDAAKVSDTGDADDMRTGWWWRRMKELTLTGYYTSQAGATQELRVNPMGTWRADIPYPAGTRSWA